jgi:hypothetical protein
MKVLIMGTDQENNYEEICKILNDIPFLKDAKTIVTAGETDLEFYSEKWAILNDKEVEVRTFRYLENTFELKVNFLIKDVDKIIYISESISKELNILIKIAKELNIELKIISYIPQAILKERAKNILKILFFYYKNLDIEEIFNIIKKLEILHRKNSKKYLIYFGEEKKKNIILGICSLREEKIIVYNNDKLKYNLSLNGIPYSAFKKLYKINFEKDLYEFLKIKKPV